MKKCMHPLLKGRNQLEFQDKLQNAMKENGIDTLILLRPENIIYATGYRCFMSYIPGMAPGISIAVVPSEGNVKLFINSLEKEAAETQTSENVEVKIYPSWCFIDDGEDVLEEVPEHLDPFAAIKLALSYAKGKIGLETDYLSIGLAEVLYENVSKNNIIDATGAVMQCRMNKTQWEIDIIRYAAQHVEKVMDKVMQEVKSGMMAAEVDNLMQKYGAEFDTEKSAVSGVFVNTYGPYYYNSGLPRGYIINEGDIIKFDGGFSHLGYQADIARTFVVGNKVGEKEKAIYKTLYKANQIGVSMLKPGVKLSEIYREIRKSVEADGVIPKYPRGHMGHSIGLSPMLEEYPQIAPKMEIELKPGMTFSLETPYASAGRDGLYAGFNLEDSFVITEDGHERLTTMANSLLL